MQKSTRTIYLIQEAEILTGKIVTVVATITGKKIHIHEQTLSDGTIFPEQVEYTGQWTDDRRQAFVIMGDHMLNKAFEYQTLSKKLFSSQPLCV